MVEFDIFLNTKTQNSFQLFQKLKHQVLPYFSRNKPSIPFKISRIRLFSSRTPLTRLSQCLIVPKLENENPFEKPFLSFIVFRIGDAAQTKMKSDDAKTKTIKLALLCINTELLPEPETSFLYLLSSLNNQLHLFHFGCL